MGYNTKGTDSNLPPEVRDRFKRHGQVYATQDIIAWTKVDEAYQNTVWRANHADELAGAVGFILLPCFWPYLIMMGICSGVCCVLELATTNKVKSDASQYYALTNLGLTSVRMEMFGALTEETAVRDVMFLQMDTIVTDTKKPTASCCHACCCVPQMPRIELYGSKTSEEKCWGSPNFVINGVENHEWFAEEIRKMEKASRENPTFMALGQANANQMQGMLAQALITNQQTAPGNETMNRNGGAMSVEDRLEQLENLRAQGLITQDEYSAKRSDILASI